MTDLSVKHLLRKAKDDCLKIEARAEMSISILKKITYKRKPTEADMIEIKKVIEILKEKKCRLF